MGMIDTYIGIIIVAIFGVIKSERVPPEELYGKRYNDQMKNCIQNIQEPRPNRATCDLSENKLAVDYICRYRVKRQRKKGSEPLITLPFNWGDVCPEAVYDHNNDEV